MAADFDEILKEIGDYGRYQKWRVWLLCIAGGILCNFSLMTTILVTYVPPHHCKLPKNATVNESIPEENLFGVEMPSRCYMYENLSFPEENFSLIKCKDGWEYDLEPYGKTVINEWDMVCGNDWYGNALITINFVVGTLGVVGFSILQDVIGRKLTFMINISWHTVFGIACALVPEPISFTVLFTTVNFPIFSFSKFLTNFT